jgi:hypothetical protein
MGNVCENGTVNLYFPRTVGTRCNRMTWGSYGTSANPTIETQRDGSGTIQRGWFHCCISATLAFKLTLSQRHRKQKFLHFLKQEFIRAPQTGGPPFVGCPRLLIQYIRSYPPYWSPFLHPQTEDAPCCGDRNPLIAANNIITIIGPSLIWFLYI